MLGNVTRIAGPLGGATEYTYDNMGRLTSESATSGGVVITGFEYTFKYCRRKGACKFYQNVLYLWQDHQQNGYKRRNLRL